MLVTGNDGTPTPTLDLNNVQIYNCSNVGILARTGNINAFNVVTNNCGEASIAFTFGGSYTFTHCTFANYWPSPNQTCVFLDNYDGSNQYALTQTNFNNCIIYGSTNYAINFEKKGADANFNYQFNNCLIKFNDFNNQFSTNPLFQFTGSRYSNCLIARNTTTNKPDFKNPSDNQLIIGQASAAKGTADFSFSNGTFDILNKSRNTSPSDIGAYNFVIFD
ncbi:MAG: hypothetical protein HC854_13285 [Flavobacterium sp.]|nr:hypothetical protein [Flavobacterium sp.]